MEVVKFVVDQTPYAYWDWELQKKNLEFIEGIDADYFRYIAEANKLHLNSDDKHRAALSLRLAYSQGIETLFSLLCSIVQSPNCTVGWMLSYRNEELQRLVQKITQGKDVYVYSMLKERPTNWKRLAKYVHSDLGYEPEKVEWIQEGFGRLWSRSSNDIIDAKLAQEYNGAKHGLRTRSGGFSLYVGLEETPGIPAPSENMKPIGGSLFGTSYFILEKIIDDKRLNFRPRRQARNWDPENLINGLVLLSMSINNIVSFLRIVNGVPANKCKFLNPSTKGAFDIPWMNSVGVNHIDMDTVIGPDDIQPCTKDDVIESYKRAYNCLQKR